RGRPLAEMERVPGEPERNRIGEHVAGIGHQRQRAGEPAAERLGDHEAAGQQRDDQHALLVAAAVDVHPGSMVVAGMAVLMQAPLVLMIMVMPMAGPMLMSGV